MDPRPFALLKGLLIASAVVVVSSGVSRSAPDSLEANLDLPYDAVAQSDDEEQAPDVIIFYSGVYEASSVVFCLDESLSMRKNSRWEIQKREIARAIQDLSSEAEFGLVFYGAGSYTFRPKLVEANESNKQAAMAFLFTRQMTLGTCLGPGVVDALKLLRNAKSDHRAVIVAGDGRPTRCPFVRGQGRLSPAEIEQLLARTDGANPGRKAKVHTILVGTDDGANAEEFMRRLAQRHRGTFRQFNR